jgi:hypothetical protein
MVNSLIPGLHDMVRSLKVLKFQEFFNFTVKMKIIINKKKKHICQEDARMVNLSMVYQKFLDSIS